jgi:acetyl esterase
MLSRDETLRIDQVGPMPVRIYGAASGIAAPLVLHLHAGAFVTGTLDTGRTVATLLAEAGATVLSVDYPLAPHHRFPEALKRAFAALVTLHEDRTRWGSKKSRVYVAGEEAGGNLAASLALMARDQQAPPLAGQILLSPMLDPCLATRSMRQAEAGPVGCKWADGWQNYLGSAVQAAHPYAAPLESSRLARLAPALVVTAEDDVLRDESLRYAQRLRDAGVAVREHVLGAPTGWPCALTEPARASDRWAPELRDHFKVFFAETAQQRAAANSCPALAGEVTT